MQLKFLISLGTALSLFGTRGQGQTFNVLHSFAFNIDGAEPEAALTVAGGNLYGTTAEGGPNFGGTLFAVSPDGSNERIVRNFIPARDGGFPVSGVVVSGNTVYGTTQNGGGGSGTIFSVNTDGTDYRVLHTFQSPTEGGNPRGSLVLSGDLLYGTTDRTVFALRISDASFAVLHHFTNTVEGAGLQAGLVLGAGTLYGTSVRGGSNNMGVVFALGTNGSDFRLLHTFAKTSLSTNAGGATPMGGLVFSGNTLFGTTCRGGPTGSGTVFALDASGSTFTVLHEFARTNSDGANPQGTLLLSGDTLYGITTYGGAAGRGTLFAVSTSGANFTLLHSFSGAPNDGESPQAGLVLLGATVYGTTAAGGKNRNGTLFSCGPLFSLVPSEATVDIERRSKGSVTLRFAGTPGCTYLVEVATNLLPPVAWSCLSTNAADAAGNWEITYADSALHPRRFYRAQISYWPGTVPR